ncbi:MAG TPA: DEAD/DEAH box helicase family protein [Tepidisphaeraceae bacterium]|nr:DEAD/DEAH box helicase family protein [Tepidisphaeraceae bacterium]
MNGGLTRTAASTSLESPAAAAKLTFDRGTLLLTLRQIRIRSSEFAGEGWKWDARVGVWRRMAIDYARVRQALRPRFGVAFQDDVRKPPPVHWPRCDLPALREDQEAALAAWRDAHGRGVIVMPTGTGKTEIALAAMHRTGVATLIVAPIRDLMHQWHHRIFRRLGYDAGMVGDSLFNLRPITVTTYDSAYIHMAEMGDRFGLIIFDEVHHLPGPSFREAAMLCAAPFRLGLTATPERSDGRERDLAQLVGPVVYLQQISHAKGRTLADFDVVRIPVALDEQEQSRYDAAGRVLRAFLASRRLNGQPHYGWQDLCADSGKDPLARHALRAYHFRKSIENRATEKLRVLKDLFRLHGGERVIVFAGSNLMAMDVSRRFLVPTLLSHSRKKERRAVLEGFAAGTFPVLVANRVLDEGVDIPAAKVAIVIGGQASTRQAKQRLGRVLRKSGNARAVLYEVVCVDTNDEQRSRKRRRSDAYEKVRRRIPKRLHQNLAD